MTTARRKRPDDGARVAARVAALAAALAAERVAALAADWRFEERLLQLCARRRRPVDIERLLADRRGHQKEQARVEAVAAALIDAGYRALARAAHPDVGGSAEAMARLQRARDWLASYLPPRPKTKNRARQTGGA